MWQSVVQFTGSNKTEHSFGVYPVCVYPFCLHPKLNDGGWWRPGCEDRLHRPGAVQHHLGLVMEQLAPLIAQTWARQETGGCKSSLLRGWGVDSKHSLLNFGSQPTCISCLSCAQVLDAAITPGTVPLRTGTGYIRYIFVVFARLLMKMNFTIAVAPPYLHPMTSLPATPTLFGHMASSVNLLGGDKWQNTAT